MDTAILKKACSFCTYQERTQDEVRKRLALWKVFYDEAEEMIGWLIEENFINEERFAKAFAGGKFRVKNWGKRKIIFELKGRKLSTYCINSALKEINDDDYLATLKMLILKKTKELKTENNKIIKNQKVANYIIGKGFESELVWGQINIKD